MVRGLLEKWSKLKVRFSRQPVLSHDVGVVAPFVPLWRGAAPGDSKPAAPPASVPRLRASAGFRRPDG